MFILALVKALLCAELILQLLRNTMLKQIRLKYCVRLL